MLTQVRVVDNARKEQQVKEKFRTVFGNDGCSAKLPYQQQVRAWVSLWRLAIFHEGASVRLTGEEVIGKPNQCFVCCIRVIPPADVCAVHATRRSMP